MIILSTGDFMKILILILLCLSVSANPNFNQWLVNFKSYLINKYGYEVSFIDNTFDGIRYNERIIQYDRAQPEFVRSMGGYLNLVISDSRVQRGKGFLNELSNLFTKIENEYGVEGSYLVSFWALETNFSDYTGKIDLVEALATLSFDKRRSEFFKRELLELLKLLKRDNFLYPSNRIQGSWAGAMGSTQFLPTNINLYAIDYDNDGFVNMWSNRPDFLASSANFLTSVGWKKNEACMISVKLKHDFNFMNSGLGVKKSIDEWRRLGVSIPSNITTKENVSLYLPQGINGPKLLVLPNFFTTFRWNNSSKYALGICVLRDLFKDGNILSQFDLDEESFLSFQLIKLIQTKLNSLGFSVGEVDGIIGPKTYRGIQLFQKANGLTPDGYLSRELSEKILE